MARRGYGRGKVRSVQVGGGGTAWQAEYSDARGRRRRVVVGRTKAEAEHVLAKLIRDRDLELAGMGGEHGLSLSLREVAEQYIADLRTRARPRTVIGATVALERIQAALSARTVRDLKRVDVLRWQQDRVAAGAANKTINIELGTLRAALNYCVRLDQLSSNPIAGVRSLPAGVRYQRRKPRAFSDWELSKLLAAAVADDHGPKNGRPSGPTVPREPLLRALIWTGCRYGELTQATWSDLDAQRGLLTLRAETTKTQKTRAIPLRAELLETLLALPRLHAAVTGSMPGPGSRIFLTPRGKPWPANTGNLLKWVNGLLETAGIAKRDERGRVATIHGFRATWNTRMARAGVAVGTRQRGLGHATSRMTVDTYEDPSDEDLRRAIDALPAIGEVDAGRAQAVE